MAEQSVTKHETLRNKVYKIREPYKIRKSVSLESVADSGLETSRSQSLESVRSCSEDDLKVKEFQNFLIQNQSRDTKKLPEADKNGESFKDE